MSAAILAAALFLRLLIPTGFMPDVSGGSIQITICTGYGPMKMTMDGADRRGGDLGHDAKARMACPFIGLSAPTLAGADALYLIVAAIFAAALSLLTAPPPTARAFRRLRPPLRGPPRT